MNQPKLMEQEIIAALKGNSKVMAHQAMKQLRQDRQIFNFIRSLIRQNRLPDVDIEDVFHDTLLVLIKNIRLGKYKYQGQLSSYLFGIAKRICWRKAHSQRKIVSHNAEDMSELNSTENAESIKIKLERENELAMIMQQLLDRIGKTCKEVFIMLGNKYAHAEIADAMGWDNIQSAKNQVFRCRKKLRTLVETDPVIAKKINAKRWKILIK